MDFALEFKIIIMVQYHSIHDIILNIHRHMHTMKEAKRNWQIHRQTEADKLKKTDKLTNGNR